MSADREWVPLEVTFTATVLAEAAGVGWTCVLLADSAEVLGTGRAVKVTGTVDGSPLATSFMPTGDGGHMLPLKRPLLKQVGKGVGDDVTVHLAMRLS